MENDNVPIPILDGKNYAKWRIRMQCILEVKGLDEAVYGGDLLDAAEEGKPQVSAARQPTDQEKVKAARAKMILINAMDDRHTTIIMPCRSAREIWARLEQEYSDKEPTNAQALLMEYYAATMDSSKSVSEYIAYIDNLVERLSEAKHKIDPTQVMAKIASSLPQEFNNFRRTWDMLPECFKNKAQLVANLKKEEAAVKQSNLGGALIAKSFGKGSGKRDIAKEKKNSTCKWCNESGHWWKECSKRPADKRPKGCKLKRNKQPEKGQQQTQPQQRSGSSSGFTGLSAMTASFSSGPEHQMWYLDSGASEHMSGIRNWFSTYQQLADPRPVKVGSGEVLYTIGKGSICGTVWVDEKQTGVYLETVYYVPNISCNLYSIGSAARLGIETRFYRDRVRLIKNEKIMALAPRQRTISTDWTSSFHLSQMLREWNAHLMNGIVS